MKTWRGKSELPPSVNDEAVSWMTEIATGGKPVGPKPAKEKQFGDVNAGAPEEVEDGGG